MKPVWELALAAVLAASQPVFADDLFLRGRAVMPTPQRVTLRPGDISLDSSWTIASTPRIAARQLASDLAEFYSLELSASAGAPRNPIVLRVEAGAVSDAPAETAPQAYRLRIAPGRIEITGNGEPGLFYGVQTLVQLVKPGPRGTLLLPECEIEDWPRLALRFLHWDTKHHQDRMETLKRYLDWAARLKANMIGFELEDKFAYPSHPVIGAPGAYTPEELREIVRYGLERYIQVVPVVQSPAHFAYVLKHPQYAHLKADGNNYQSRLCSEDTYRLIFQMYDDLIAATPGVEYFFVSTDEVYYAGIDCAGPYTPESRSARWAEFARRAHDHLASKGRRMLAWLEYPLLARDLETIPAGVIDGVVGDERYVEVEKRKGMRQLVYVSTQGAEFLFPDHLAIESLPEDARLGEFESVFTSGRLRSLHQAIPDSRAMKMNPIGSFGAAWDDSGLHNETFWLGWSAAARWSWHPGEPGPEQHAAEFMRIYYGAGSEGLVEVYRSLQRQARTWQRCWDRVVSRVRGPGYGNSDGKGLGTERHDLTLEPPPLPEAGTLAFQPRFGKRYQSWLAQLPGWREENDRLQHQLSEAMLRVDRNQYNLEVLLALSRFTGQHWKLLSALSDAERALERAAVAAAAGRHSDAVEYLVAASNLVTDAEAGASAVRGRVEAVFEKSRFPNGRPVGGRQFVQILDDSKDHWAGRTADLGFMFAPQSSIGLPAWRGQLVKILRDYAAAHHVAVRGLAEPGQN